MIMGHNGTFHASRGPAIAALGACASGAEVTEDRGNEAVCYGALTGHFDKALRRANAMVAVPNGVEPGIPTV